MPARLTCPFLVAVAVFGVIEIRFGVVVVLVLRWCVLRRRWSVEVRRVKGKR